MRAIFFIPSFYGIIGWSITFVLYLIGPTIWNPIAVDTIVIFVALYVSFLTSTGILRRSYELRLLTPDVPRSMNDLARVIVLLHSVGLLGLVIYVIDFSSALGGLEEFFFVLFNNSLEIRGLAGEMASLGTQVGYVGWVAIWLSVYVFQKSNFSPTLLILSLMQFLGNLLYVDRTKPIWLIFVTVLISIAASRNIRVASVIRALFFMLGLSLLGLLLYLIWTGKGFDQKGNMVDALSALVEHVSVYSTSGIVYFNHILQIEQVKAFSLQRTFTPIFTILNLAGFTEPPPPVILDFYYVPNPTNVGTALEPLYRDGGAFYVVIGIVVLSFGVDIVALRFFQKGNPFALIIWSNLCFASFFTFFAPRFNSFAINIIILCGIAGLSISQFLRAKRKLDLRIFWEYSQTLRTHQQSLRDRSCSKI
jgi:oligosaccharide repeat unit polymerase